MFRQFLFILTPLFINIAIPYAQSSNNYIKNKITEMTFKTYDYQSPPKHTFLSPGKSIIAKINPLNYITAGLLFFYQNMISEQIQAKCMYELSCSEYAKVVIQKHGFLLGVLKGADQINNCFKQVLYDYPQFKISENFKIKNNPEPVY